MIMMMMKLKQAVYVQSGYPELDQNKDPFIISIHKNMLSESLFISGVCDHFRCDLRGNAWAMLFAGDLVLCDPDLERLKVDWRDDQ